MEWFRLGNLAISSLSTTILFAVMTGYMLTVKKKSADAWFITGYIAILFILMVSYTVRISIFSSIAAITGQFSNLIVFAVVFLIQFGYYYGGNYQKKESLIVLIISLVLAGTVWGSRFFSSNFPMVYDFQAQYFTLEYGPEIGIVTLSGYLWSFVVLLRKKVMFSMQEIETFNTGQLKKKALYYLIHPVGRKAHSAGSFAILTFLTSLIALSYLLFQSGIISRNSYSLIFNTSSMVVCFIIFIVYLNNEPQPRSFFIKLILIPLAAIMVTIGFIASALLPLVTETMIEQYQRKVELVRLSITNNNYIMLPEDAVYVLPVSAETSILKYIDPALVSNQLLEKFSNDKVSLLIQDSQISDPDLFYLNLNDPDSFIIQYILNHNGISHRVGFSYASFRLSLHNFWVKFIPVVFGITAFVLLIFPVVFKNSIMKPLNSLLEAVRQVEGGNYNLALSVKTEDEVGQLAHGYNRMVQALRNAEGNFKALAENANDAILILLKDGRIAYANNRAIEISGFDRRLLLKKNFRELIHPEFMHKVEARFSARMHVREVSKAHDQHRMNGSVDSNSYEIKIINKNNHTIPVEITGSRTYWHNNPADVVILRDITERKQAEELLHTQTQQLIQAEKLASIGALVAGVAHEVNNPNQVISMNARFLSEGLPTLFMVAESDEELDDSLKIAGMVYEEFQHAANSAVNEIDSSTKRIDRIVGELKSFASGGVKGEQGLIDVNEVVHAVVDLSRFFIHKATDHFSLELGEMIPKVRADSIQLEQVILNLVQNACQALADKDKSITIRTKYDETSKKIKVEICDQGKGISKDNLIKITDPFFTTRREAGGTGLGLSISKRIIKNLGGTIGFNSTEGNGTTVLVSIPEG
ncbi:MAG: PAS domain S-box protein [Spirochaetales bacterium]|nr:PAS domain S-box protein [Spirochaetales bacterium]